MNEPIISTSSSLKTLFLAQKSKSLELRTESVGARKIRLQQLEDWILSNQVKIREALYSDLKKHKNETDISEILPAITELREAKRHLKSWTKPKSYRSGMTYLGTKAHVQFEPKGVCLIISPWNYPFNLTLGPLISAIAAGNTFIIKPSEFTPHTSSLLAAMIKQLFPEDIGKVLEGEVGMATELLKLPFDHVFFTGSPAVGKIVMKAAALNLSSVTLELGGKSPTIVDKTCNLQDAGRKIAWGKWLNAGQTCVAPDYVFVHKSIAVPLIQEIRKWSEHFYGKDEVYTAIVNEKHFNRLSQMLVNSISGSVKLAFGGEMNQDQLKIQPTLVEIDKNDQTPLLEEEIFGPILPLMTYESIDEVIGYINDRPKPLALYIFSNHSAFQKDILTRTSSGTVVINDTLLQFSHPTLPFGGVNNSGIGKSHGIEGFKAFSNEKSVLKQRTGITMARTFYPPYTPLKNNLIQFLLRYF